jgi:hypothetical protein
MEIATFPIYIMFVHCDSIVEFVTCKVQHVVACIANVVIQVHGLGNQKYELIVTNGTKPGDIITFSLWNFFSSSYKELVNLFSTCAPTTNLLKNVSSIIYGEVKLISTLSSIIIFPVPNKKVQEHLEDIHKALTMGTTFWTNLKVI